MGEEIKTVKVGFGDGQESPAAYISFSLLPVLKLSLIATDEAIGKSFKINRALCRCTMLDLKNRWRSQESLTRMKLATN
jgi:hypothetical protein